MIITENVDCNFCGEHAHKIVYSEGRLKLVRCNNCGFNYVNPRIKKEELDRHYDEDHAQGTEVARRRLKNAPVWQQVVTDTTQWSQRQWRAHNKWLRSDIGRIMKYKKGGKLLDVGCGDGARLQVAFDNGWDVYGLEVSNAAIEKLKKRFNLTDSESHFKNASIRESGFPYASFDAITYWSVLEHVVDPLENLQEASRLLKKGGILAIRVPNVREEFLRKYQRNLAKFLMPLWMKKLCGMRDLKAIPLKEVFDLSYGTSGVVGGLDLELHVNHFSDNTLTMFLEKSGFKVLENRDGEVSLSLYKMNIKLLAQLLVRSFLQIPYYCSFRRRFNFSQQLFFIARKV